MGETEVLIKFISPHAAENVISGIALDPELLIFVGYDQVLSDERRNHYNYFFHHRHLRTTLTEPLRLERYLEPEMELRLTELLEHYADRSTVIDLTDADALQSMALGVVLRGHRSWNLSVISADKRRLIYFIQKNAGDLRKVYFPNLSESELQFLRTGSPVCRSPVENAGSNNLTRRDMDRETIAQIRALSRKYADRPDEWREASEYLKNTEIGENGGRLEYLLDSSTIPIREEFLEDLLDAGVLTTYIRRGGIARLVFSSGKAIRLACNIHKLPILQIFLIAAFQREYDGTAAYHDLTLRNDTWVTGIRRCVPIVIAMFSETEGAAQLYRFCEQISHVYDSPVKRILVHAPYVIPTEEERRAAETLDVELLEVGQLRRFLEPQ